MATVVCIQISQATYDFLSAIQLVIRWWSGDRSDTSVSWIPDYSPVKILTVHFLIISGAKVPLAVKPPQPAKPLPKFPSGIQMVRRAPGASPVQQQQPAPPSQPVPAKGVKRPHLADQENSAAPPFKNFQDADGATRAIGGKKKFTQCFRISNGRVSNPHCV